MLLLNKEESAKVMGERPIQKEVISNVYELPSAEKAVNTYMDSRFPIQRHMDKGN